MYVCVYICISGCMNWALSLPNLKLFPKVNFVLRGKKQSKSFIVNYKTPAYPFNLISSSLDYFVPIIPDIFSVSEMPSCISHWGHHLYRCSLFLKLCYFLFSGLTPFILSVSIQVISHWHHFPILSFV